MRDILILTEADLRGLVSLDLEAVDVVERAFGALASGRVVMPPILTPGKMTASMPSQTSLPTTVLPLLPKV